MKKSLSIIVIVLALMAIFVSSVAAAGGKSVSLVGVQYTKGGVVLHFNTSGLSKADLKNVSFYADGKDQNISCNFVDGGPTVRCVVAKHLAGEGSFYVSLAGFGSRGQLPQEKTGGASASCGEGEIAWYSVDEFYWDEYEGSFDVPVWVWNEHEAEGGFEEDAESGWTYEITGEFCAPDEEWD